MYCSGASRRRRVENSIKSILNKYSLTPGLHWEIKLLNISDILMWRRLLFTERKSRMWFAPSLLHTEALQRIIRSNRNRLEVEMHELILDILDRVGSDTFSFCPDDILVLLTNSHVKAERHQVRRVLQERWKLKPAHNTLTYTTYQVDYTRECRYAPKRTTGRFYTVTREFLETL